MIKKGIVRSMKWIGLYVVVYGIVYLGIVLVVVFSSGMRINTTIYNRQGSSFVDETDLAMLQDNYGIDNVTRVNRWLSRGVEHAYFVDPSFIETGMTAIHLEFETDIVETVTLLDGTIWEAGTTDRVMIIDQHAADWLNISVGDTYEINTNSGSYWEVIGIVSNVSLPGSFRGELHLDLPKYQVEEPIIPRVYYIPYSLRETIDDEDDDETGVDTLIIQSKNVFHLKRDTDAIGNYLEEKNGVSNWTYNNVNVINVLTLVKNETQTREFLALVLLVYGVVVGGLFMKKRYIDPYRNR